MLFQARCIRLTDTTSAAGAIRAVNRVLAGGGPVYRWRGPRTPFADPGDLIFPGTTTDILPAIEPLKLTGDDTAQLAALRPGRVALLWDKSFLWGYMAVCTLRDLGFCFDLITAESVREGGLSGYQIAVVPGGWASLKYQALGAGGMEQIRRFVERGGGYLGLCGGAGLALQVDEGLGLLPVSRKSMTERLPNFSGSIRVHRTSNHPLWWGLQEEACFQVWWPSQFELLEPEKIQVLGKYGEPESDFWVSDLNVQDTETAGFDWERLEEAYEINLDPRRLLNEPAIVECKCGQGRVVLSYPHLETPGDAQGNLALFNVWYDLLSSSMFCDAPYSNDLNMSIASPLEEQSLNCVRILAREADELIALGARRQLWSWRNPWLLQWRRGVRGSEFGTVCVMLRGLVRELERCRATARFAARISTQQLGLEIRELDEIWQLFKSKARALLEAEATDMNGHALTEEAGLSDRVRELRTQMFGCVHCYGSKSYGGLYRRLLDQIDTVLFGALLANSQEQEGNV